MDKQPKPYINPYLAGAILGVVLFLSIFFSGSGLGASGGIHRIIMFFQSIVTPNHVNSSPYLAKVAGGYKNPLANWYVVMLIGLAVGGFTSGWLNNRVRIEINKGPNISNRTRLVLAFIGGAIMGYGARFARGCTSGQALSGGAVLSVGSWALMFCIFGGAYGLAWFLRKVWN